jgi:hypothetical protein
LAGSKQHFIPRSVLRGFLAAHDGNAEKVWVYRKNRHFFDSIENVAAQRHYYSRPSGDGSKTLDDYITDYENRLGLLLRELRALPVGSTAHANAAAEVTAHLAPRSNHVRGIFVHGMTTLAEGANRAFLDPGNVARLIGLDDETPSDRFKEMIGGVLQNLPQRQMLDQMILPTHVLERILFIAAREGFGDFFAQQAPSIQALLSKAFGSAKDTIKQGHNEALARSLIPEPRLDDLRSLAWTIEIAPSGGAVLPDCVALGVEEGGAFTSYLMTGKAKSAAVIMPLTSEKLLVGRRDSAFAIDLVEFNRAAAACSHDFFIASFESDPFIGLIGSIGSQSTVEIDKAVAAALETFAAPVFDVEGGLVEADDLPPTRYSDFQLSFQGCADEDTAARVSDVVQYVVGQFSRYMPLERLDGITFAADYPAALRELDRGFDASAPLKTISGDLGVGLAQCPIVVRDGVKKSRIVVRGEYAHALISEDDPQASGFALHLLVYELAEAALIQKLDQAFPGFLLQPCPDQHTGDLYRGVHGAIVSYYTARASAGFGADEIFDSGQEDVALSALDHCQAAILAAKDSYEKDGDVAALFGTALDAVSRVLTALACVAGQRDGMEQPIMAEAGALGDALRQRGLRAWFDQFHKDMNLIWRTSGSWSSIDLFFAQRKHVERLLWPFGIIPWAENGGTYVRVMLPNAPDGTQDAA